MSTFVYQVSKGCIYQKEKNAKNYSTLYFLSRYMIGVKVICMKKLGFHPRIQNLFG